MQFGHFSVESKKIARLTDRPDNVDFVGLTLVRFNDRRNLVVALIKRRPDQIVHAGVDNGEFFAASLFDVANARQQNAGVPDKKATGFKQNLNTQVT